MKKMIPDKSKCEHVANILKILSHPLRLLILCYLADGEKSVQELEELTEASQSSVSQYLAKMKSEGLVSSERRSSFVYYKIENQEVNKIIQALYKIYVG